MAIIVEEDPLLLGVPAQGCTKLLYFINSGIEALLVPSLWQKKKGDTCHTLGRAREILLLDAKLQGAAKDTGDPKLLH